MVRVLVTIMSLHMCTEYFRTCFHFARSISGTEWGVCCSVVDSPIYRFCHMCTRG